MNFPLRCLLKKTEPWLFTAFCEAAILKLKAELCSDQVIIPFDPKLPIILTTDASHENEGVERPIKYASSSLKSSEIN